MGWVMIYFIIGLVIGFVWQWHKDHRKAQQALLAEQERANQRYEDWK